MDAYCTMVSRIQSKRECTVNGETVLWSAGRAGPCDKMLLGVVTSSRPCWAELGSWEDPHTQSSAEGKDYCRKKAID